MDGEAVDFFMGDESTREYMTVPYSRYVSSDEDSGDLAIPMAAMVSTWLL